MSVNDNFNKCISKYLRTSKDISPSKVEIIKRILAYDDDKIRKFYEPPPPPPPPPDKLLTEGQIPIKPK